MRIRHVVFCLLALVYGAETSDDDLDERTNIFIRDKLIPALKLAEVTKVNFTRLHLCHCSREVGCNARTTGWVPGIEFLNETDRSFYENTCYTDGSCYQSARPSPEISHFGCMDEKSVTDETEFHDTAAKVCTNNTKDPHATVWICCDKGNFCANETIIHLAPGPQQSSTWLILTILALLTFIVLLGIAIFLTRKSWEAKFDWYIRFKPKPGDPLRETENNVPMVTMGDGAGSSVPEVAPIEQQGSTMSTSAGNSFPPGIMPNNMKDMLDVLEETSGSGMGPTTLHKLTIGGQIRLTGRVGSGRFGNVSRGDYRGEAVAVKVFNALDEPAFHKETEIFETRMLRHPNVLRYIGSDRVDTGFVTELWLVTEYHPSGSLHDFLLENTVNIETYYNLMRSTASGLAFLHNQIGGSKESNKPAMAHRDIKSKNIMVKNDLTCAIGDLGLSLSKPEDAASDIIANENYKCGTRYLAPEILNSTMQFTVFESYQCADVYSFSLVMWETLCRCEDGDVLPREAATVIPYIEWTDRDPQDAQMFDVVCTRRLRPTENPLWKDHPEMKHIMEIIKTCWNGNPSARFTSYICRKRMDERQQLLLDKKAKAVAQTAGVTVQDRKILGPQKPKDESPANGAPRIVQKEIDREDEQENWRETAKTPNGHISSNDDSSRPLLG
ncbi:Cell surface receptor daf-1 [Caenorhabditis elegans]|uniref:Isoform b of Cell surface receptor daf-1 n=1 Tax=Caenorhabditis elegans TaxID=6239 RepID=P20792-2|nr:Cell surface receptor daf-1 [Caenorhabditis elegans]CCD62176.1 Cell surface receptor daf-1 [Caenorhabditis elegans]|eukprot:NP_001023160.1 Cell surface receptor daf-1 [Caenorhabditis elegans]